MWMTCADYHTLTLYDEEWFGKFVCATTPCPEWASTWQKDCINQHSQVVKDIIGKSSYHVHSDLKFSRNYHTLTLYDEEWFGKFVCATTPCPEWASTWQKDCINQHSQVVKDIIGKSSYHVHSDLKFSRNYSFLTCFPQCLPFLGNGEGCWRRCLKTS